MGLTDLDLKTLKTLRLEGPLDSDQLIERGCLWNRAHFSTLINLELVEVVGSTKSRKFQITTKGLQHSKEIES